jgi:hypothetical protein
MNFSGSLLEDRVLSLDQATPGTGPIAPAIDVKLSPRDETYLSLDHNIRSKVDNNFTPIINSQDVSSQQYVNDKYVNFTGREQINPTVVEQTNLKGHDEFHNLSINDARVTTNQTTHYSYAGNAQREHDGSNWWRYEDAPKVTTNQTTNYSYAGNAQREHDGSNYWRYKDAPRVTTNQTTLYSYSGDAAGTVSSHNQTNRVQFTGTTYYYTDENGEVKAMKTTDSGVTNWGQKGETLVEGYVPGSNGNMNIQLDPDEKQGYTELRSDWFDINTSGAGSYEQAIPNAERFQQVSTKLIGDVLFNPNRVESEDNRQTANYLITNLQQNDFSIYQRPHLRGSENFTTTFNIDSNAQDYSGISTQTVPYKELEKQKLNFGERAVFTDDEKVYNPNNVIVYNTYGQLDSNIENPFLFQTKKPQNAAVFMGKGYSGSAIKANEKYNNPYPRILLDTDSKLSSQYLDMFSPNGCLAQNQCVY